MSRKPLIFLSVFNVFEKVGSVFFEKPVFHFKPSEASFSGVMCLASWLLENPKWLLENPKWLLENPKGRQIGRRRSAAGRRSADGTLLTGGFINFRWWLVVSNIGPCPTWAPVQLRVVSNLSS